MRVAATMFRLWRTLDAAFGRGFLASLPTDVRSRLYTKWLRRAGAEIAEGSLVHHNVRVWNPENIRIAIGVRIPAATDMAGMGPITIGNHAQIGARVSFITNHHEFGDRSLPWNEVMCGTQQPIDVGAQCWIMNGVTLVAGRRGLRIGPRAWIAAGAVVTRDVPPDELWGGIPARLIRKLQTADAA